MGAPPPQTGIGGCPANTPHDAPQGTFLFQSAIVAVPLPNPLPAALGSKRPKETSGSGEQWNPHPTLTHNPSPPPLRGSQFLRVPVLQVFLKTFKSPQEFPGRSDAVVSAVVEELETAERTSKVRSLIGHPNIVSVLKVPRGALIRVPRCGTEDTSFHGIVTEYADGGELCHYLVLPANTTHENVGIGGNCSFTEPQARFLFQQIVELLKVLHHPKGGDAYFHGDLKDSNLVIDGSTLKLIDYGSLSKVEEEVGPVQHASPAYRQVLWPGDTAGAGVAVRWCRCRCLCWSWDLRS